MNIFLLEDGHCLREHALEVCKLSEARILQSYQATSLHTIVQMVANGIGMTLLPKLALDAGIFQCSEIKTKNFYDKNIWRSIALAWRTNCPRQKEYQMRANTIKKYPLEDKPRTKYSHYKSKPVLTRTSSDLKKQRR